MLSLTIQFPVIKAASHCIMQPDRGNSMISPGTSSLALIWLKAKKNQFYMNNSHQKYLLLPSRQTQAFPILTTVFRNVFSFYKKIIYIYFFMLGEYNKAKYTLKVKKEILYIEMDLEVMFNYFSWYKRYFIHFIPVNFNMHFILTLKPTTILDSIQIYNNILCLILLVSYSFIQKLQSNAILFFKYFCEVK